MFSSLLGVSVLNFVSRSGRLINYDIDSYGKRERVLCNEISFEIEFGKDNMLIILIFGRGVAN